METTWDRDARHKGTRAKQKVARWVGVILIVAGLVFSFAVLRYHVRLLVFGTSATGQVVDFDRTPKGRQVPVIQVKSDDGKIVEFRSPSIKGSGLAAGDVVPVRYIMVAPVLGEVISFRRFWLGLIMISALAIATLVGGIAMLRKWSGWFG